MTFLVSNYCIEHWTYYFPRVTERGKIMNPNSIIQSFIAGHKSLMIGQNDQHCL